MIIIGHRGARGLAPENTIEAIEAAILHHVDEVEVDVRVTKDLVPILSHNATVLVHGRHVKIATLTLNELWAVQPSMPTLAETLEAINGQVVAHLEIKPGEPVEPIAEIIRESLKSGVYALDRILLASKQQKTLRALSRELPTLQTIVIEKWSGVRGAWRARRMGTKRISMRSWWLWPGFLRAMHTRGYQITPYTMNDPAKVKRWEKYIYGVVTDYPDRFEK